MKRKKFLSAKAPLPVQYADSQDIAAAKYRYTHEKCCEGVTYSAYGVGAKPRLYGSQENGADASKWSLWYENGSKKIWLYDKELSDVGLMVFNNGESYTTKAAQDYAKKQDADTVILYVLSDMTQPSGGNGIIGIDGKTVKLTAESNATNFTLPNGTLFPPEGNGVVEFDNVTIVRTLTGTNNYDIDLRGFDFVLGENAKVSGQVTINQRWSGDVTLND